MKLTSLYISDFGNLHDFKIDFSNNLYLCREENGFGKSTLILFIKAMFYGLRKNKDQLDERIKIIPFSKPQSSGYIEFSFDGSNYKIERVFFKKKSDDILVVYKNSKKTDELGLVPGETIFGMDEDSFIKTISISTNDLVIEPTETLKKKIAHFVEDNDDDTDFENAKNKLETYRKTFTPKNKSDEKGLIATKKKQIEDLESKNSNLNKIKESTAFKYESLKKINDDIDVIQKQISESINLNNILHDWEMLDKYESNVQQIEENIRSINELYPFGIPSKEESRNIKKLINDKDHHLTEIKSLEDSIDNEKIDELNKHFNESSPTDEEIDLLTKLHHKYLVITEQKDKPLTSEEITLVDRFKGNETTVTKLKENINDYHSLYQTDFNSSSKATAKTKKNYILEIVLLTSSIILMFFGVIISLISKEYLFFLIAGLGLLLLFTTGFIYLQKQLKNKSSDFAHDNLISKRENLMNLILDELLLLKYDIKANKIEDSINRFTTDYFVYESIKSRQNEDKQYELEQKSEADDIANKLRNFYEKYHYDIDIKGSYQSFINDISIYNNLMPKYKTNKNQICTLQNQVKIIDEKITAFADKYHVENISEYLETLEGNRIILSSKGQELNDANNDLIKFKEEKHLLERPEIKDKVNVDELNNRLHSLNSNKAKVQNDIEKSEEEIETLSNDVSFIDTFKDELNDLKKKEYIIKNTLSILVEAEQSLKNRYIAPLKDTFVKYISFLEEAIGKKVVMNSDFEISIIEDGVQRDYRHLSNGQLVLTLFCYRLALLDNVFLTDKPFVLIDDAFAFLDEKHFSKAQELLKSLSSSRQILYFTCHSCRDIK